MKTEKTKLSAVEYVKNIQDATAFQDAVMEIQGIDLSYCVEATGHISFNERSHSPLLTKDVYFNIFKWVFGVQPRDPDKIMFNNEGMIYDIHSVHDRLYLRVTNKISQRYLFFSLNHISSSCVYYGMYSCSNLFDPYGVCSSVHVPFINDTLNAIYPFKLEKLLLEYLKTYVQRCVRTKDKFGDFIGSLSEDEECADGEIIIYIVSKHVYVSCMKDGTCCIKMNYMKTSKPISITAECFMGFAAIVNDITAEYEQMRQTEMDEQIQSIEAELTKKIQDIRHIKEQNMEVLHRRKTRLEKIISSIHK
jgi:hypothetical protein